MDNEQRINGYFLGNLSSAEAEHLESECFADETFAEAVFVIEEDLVDRYLAGELTANQRERFEQFYLTTSARRERVSLARALKTNFASAPSIGAHKNESKILPSAKRRSLAWVRRPSPVLIYVLGVIVLCAVGLGLWQLLGHERQGLIARRPIEAINGNSKSTPPPEVSPSVNVAPSPAEASTPPLPSTHPEIATAVFTVNAGTMRDPSGGEQTLKITPQTRTVELNLVLQNTEKKTYRVEIHTVEGEKVLVRPVVNAVTMNKQTVLTLRASASLFSKRDYVARVFDKEGEPAASYVFRFTKTK